MRNQIKQTLCHVAKTLKLLDLNKIFKEEVLGTAKVWSYPCGIRLKL